MKKIAIIVVIIILVVIGAYFALKSLGGDDANNQNPVTNNPAPTEPTTPVEPVDKTKTVIGKSVEGRDITAYHFGEGSDEILFVGGIHGGYSANTSLVSYQLMDYLKANPTAVPSNVKVTVIPVLNPDGLNKVVPAAEPFEMSDITATAAEKIAARFNDNNVDLNRNFDCEWKPTSKWQSRDVSGGTAAFSEPEALALKNYADAHELTAVVAWYSAAGGVFSSSCHNGVSAETSAITKAYAQASGYKPYESFDFYEITGDMVNWFAKNDIPAISVLLTNHTDTDWTKNQKGIAALLKHYTKTSTTTP